MPDPNGPTAMTSDTPLPHFDRPPVIETILGVAFRPLGWQVPHFGLFWDRIRDEYPEFQVQPGIPRPGGDEEVDGVEEVFLPSLRCWFLEAKRSRLLQVQHNLFLHNWRKVGANVTYPRYEPTIRPAFHREWERFVEFLADQDLSTPAVVGAEVTYVNQFEKGQEWQEPQDLARLLRFFHFAEPDLLSSVQSARCSFRFDAPDIDGRIEVDLSHAVRNNDMKEVFQLNISAKGRPAGATGGALMQWMDRGREHVVRGFVEVTTEEAHQMWERKA